MPVGVAVVGVGGIGALHARNLAGRVPGVGPLKVVDRDAQAARALASELALPWSTSYEQALDDPDVDAVVVATPSPLHAQMVEQAAVAGRHVFCEKPLALDCDAGRRAARAAALAGTHLQVGFQRRFDRGWLALKALVDEGRLGDLTFVHISHRNRSQPYGSDRVARLGSLFVDMTVHDFDSVRWLAGEVAALRAFATPDSSEDPESAVIVLRLECGALGVIENTRAVRYGFDCRVEVVGRESTVRLEGMGGAGVALLTPQGAVSPLPADHVERHGDAYLAELRDFVDGVREGRAPAVGADEALGALELSLAAERSHRCSAQR